MTHDSAKMQIRNLNEYLRTELAAVKTYEYALRVPGIAAAACATLEGCRFSHLQRANVLRTEILRLGGDPETGSGVWASFARFLSLGASDPSEAIHALEEDEDRCLRDYESKHATRLPAHTFRFLRDFLTPEQYRAHRALATLKQRLV